MQTGWQLRRRLTYWFDNLFSSGTHALIIWLALLSLIIILSAAAVLTITGLAPAGESPYTFVEAAWLSLIRTMGGGSAGGRDSTWTYRLLMLAVTFGGIFIISALIGILTSGMNRKMEDLRKGRSVVMEKGHIVLLGWTEQVFSIISELVQANIENRRSCIVVLGPQDKVAMEDEIRRKVGETGALRVVCRTGNPMEISDLSVTSLNEARAIIVLSPDVENPDAEVLKIILAITNHPNRREKPYHIIASIRNPKNYEVAEIVGRGEVEWIRSGEMVARIIAQTCRQSGLSTVYTNLFDFGHDEFYFYPVNGLAGKTFQQALNEFPRDTVVGMQREGHKPKLNPTMETVLEPNDTLILIARDNSGIQQAEPAADVVNQEVILRQPMKAPAPEHTLVLGWNWRGPGILREMDHYVAPGSDVLVVADKAGLEETVRRGCQDLVRQSVCYRTGDTTDRETLEELDLAQLDHIIVLCYSDSMTVQQADAQTMITLLHLRDLAELRGYRYSIVSEMLDIRNRKVAVVTRADDFIVSDRLVSLLMAQVAEKKELNQVFGDLFDYNGSEIYLRPIEQYVQTGLPVNFYTVVEAAAQRNEVAIGYRLLQHAKSVNEAYGVVMNPAKAAEIPFCPGDRVIVLAEV